MSVVFMDKETAEIIGKTIAGVIIKECENKSPATQVFLLFTDGSYYEFYGAYDYLVDDGNYTMKAGVSYIF